MQQENIPILGREEDGADEEMKFENRKKQI